MKDYYYILGISRNASKEEIKKAYREFSLRFHSDKNNNDKYWEERFNDINEAYETLIDSEERKIYDGKLAAQTNNIGGNYSLDNHAVPPNIFKSKFRFATNISNF
jgi:DnaJ-class molecular chaperone